MAQVTFNNPIKYAKQKELFIAPEGMYTGQVRQLCRPCNAAQHNAGRCAACTHAPRMVQFLYAGKRATLTIGNIKPIGEMPEGTIVCNVESVSPPAFDLSEMGSAPMQSLAA